MLSPALTVSTLLVDSDADEVSENDRVPSLGVDVSAELTDGDPEATTVQLAVINEENVALGVNVTFSLGELLVLDEVETVAHDVAVIVGVAESNVLAL